MLVRRKPAPPPEADAIKVDCSEQLILPGLVNTHTHTGMSFFRNLLEDLSSPDWFRYEQEAERFLSQEDIYWAALLGAYELLRQGVTTTADRFSHMDIIVSALDHAGLRAIVAPSLVDRDADARKQQTLDLLEQYGSSGDGLIHVGPRSCRTGFVQYRTPALDSKPS